MEILVPRLKFEEMFAAAAVQQISEGYVKKTVFYNNKEIVITGTSSSGEHGHIAAWGHEVVCLQVYKGSLKPITYNEHHLAVHNGTRKRGYEGIKVKHEKRMIVFTGEQMIFKPTEGGNQISMF